MSIDTTDKHIDQRDVIKKVFTCHDNEIPKEADFSENCDRIFSITEKGLFSSTDFERLEQLVNKEFKKNTVAMLVFKKSPLIFIAFENDLLVQDVSDKYSIKEISGFSKQYLETISDMKVSAKEEILAVALEPSGEKQAKIEIYAIDTDLNNLHSKHTIDNISSKIEFMDFSLDGNYLMYKDNQQQKCFFDQSNMKKNDTQAIEFDIEWVSEGIKISEKRKGLISHYANDCSVTCLVKAGERSQIACDEIGTIRIFEYPCETTGYSRIYAQHLNYINTCHVSVDGEYLITTSQFDRCIFMWKIIKKEQGLLGEEDFDVNRDNF